MSRQIEFHPLARHELDHAVDWYEDQQTGLGDRFNSGAVDLLETIARHPLQYAEVENRLREARVRRFPY